RRERAVADRGERAARVAGRTERIEPVEGVVAAAIPERVAEERRTDHARRVATGDLALRAERGLRVGNTQICGLRRIGVDAREDRRGEARGADAIVVAEVARRERLARPRDTAAREHRIRPRVERVDPPVVGAAEIVTARARGLAVATGLDVPEQ